MKGRPIRGFFAGLLLGICLDLDLVLGGVVKLDSSVLWILPVALDRGVLPARASGRRSGARERCRKVPSQARFPRPLPGPIRRRRRAAPHLSRKRGRRLRRRSRHGALRRARRPKHYRRSHRRRFDRRPASRWHAPMDFNDSPEEAAWRAECRELARSERAVRDGPRCRCRRRRHVRARRRRYLERARKWQALKFDAGFARITWEPEFGGRNGTTMQQIIFGQEEGRFDVPTAVFVIGLGMIAPDPARVRHRRAEAALPHEAAARRGDLEPAVQRAGRRLRRRVTLDDRGSRRRRVGASTARRSGRRARSTPTSARSSAAPIPTPRSTRASPRSSSTCAHPA